MMNNVKTKKKPKTKEKVKGGKKPKEVVQANSYLGKNPVWRFHRSDSEHSKWSLQEKSYLDNELIEKLIGFEGMTWQQIQNASGGRSSGTNSHFIDVEDLITEAKSRLVELNVYNDQLFSLRLTGSKRLFGILEDGVFHVIWYDRNHEICPSKKRNT